VCGGGGENRGWVGKVWTWEAKNEAEAGSRDW